MYMYLRDRLTCAGLVKTRGVAVLQNVSTYNFFVYLHNYVARDEPCTNIVNRGISIDFAHQGPVFPVWHRRYLLIVEKEFQRITANDSFGLPYWQWEENDMSAFTEEYYGVPANSFGPPVDVQGKVINSNNWNTICDFSYWKPDLTCSQSWSLCNPENDLGDKQPLQRGDGSTYLPNIVEVMIAIAAPSYDAYMTKRNVCI